MKKHLLTLLALTVCLLAGSQTVHFGTIVGTGGDPNGYGSTRLSSGNFINVSATAGGLELRTFNNSGVLLTTKRVTHPSYNIRSVATVVPAGSNAILVTGQTINGMGEFFVARIDLVTYAVTITTKPIDLFPYTKGPKVFYANDGIYALYPQYNYFDINKLDHNLNTLWTKTFECDTTTGKNPGMDCEVVDSSIIIVGKCDSILGCGDIDTSGTMDSMRLYLTQGYTRIYGITAMPDGNLLISGLHATTYASSYSSPLLAKITRSGQVLWATILDEATPAVTFSRFVDAAVLPDGRIAGFASYYEAYDDTYFEGVCYFDANGNYQSSKKFGDYNSVTGTGSFYQLYDMKVYADGILMTGNITDYSNGATVKQLMIFTDAEFSQVCHQTTVNLTASPLNMGTVMSYGNGSVRKGEGVPSVTGSMGTLASVMNPNVSVCSISTGTNEEETVASNVYPNPVIAGEMVNVQMETPAAYEFIITDLSGKMVSRQTTIGNRMTLSTQGLATGAYLLNIMSSNRTVAIEKLMVK